MRLADTRKATSTRRLVRPPRRLLALGMAALAAPLVLQGTPPPGWWNEQGVVDPSQQTNDFAAVNQGQVKFMATQALAELDTYLPGGAGAALHQLVDAWGTPTPQTNDFAAVNAGQLKRLAAPFYDQLVRVGYASAYPWSGSSASANDFAAVNQGQVKNLFTFDLSSTDAAHDANGNGLPDWWERFYGLPAGATATGTLPWDPTLTYRQAFERRLNPVDFFDGQVPTLAMVSGDGQHGAPGERVPLPLTVRVTTTDGQPWANAPVLFRVTKGNGLMQRSSSRPGGSTLTLFTDGNGQARVFFQLSSTPTANNQDEVKAQPITGSYPAITFTEYTDRNVKTNPSPFAPGHVVARINHDFSMDISWENNSDDAAPIVISGDGPNGTTIPLTSVPAGTTHVHIPPPVQTPAAQP